MHNLLKQAQSFLAQAIDNIEAVKVQKRQEIQNHINNYDIKKIYNDIKNYYSFIKEDPKLISNIANILTGEEEMYKSINQNHKELANAIFGAMIHRHYSYYQINDAIRFWGPILDHKLIRQYEQQIIAVLKSRITENKNLQKETPLSDDENIKHIISHMSLMARDPKIAPYIDKDALERIISSINPKQLPAFDNDKRQLKTTDILKLLVSERGAPPLTMEKLKSIFVRSSPQAQQILRSVLWEGEKIGGKGTIKFMLDEAGSSMGLDGKLAGIYGKVMPVREANWRDDFDDRDKWLEMFNDYKLAPFIQF